MKKASKVALNITEYCIEIFTKNNLCLAPKSMSPELSQFFVLLGNMFGILDMDKSNKLEAGEIATIPQVLQAAGVSVQPQQVQDVLQLVPTDENGDILMSAWLATLEKIKGLCIRCIVLGLKDFCSVVALKYKFP